MTAREHLILELISEGLTNRQIGVRLHLAEKTVKNNVTTLLRKLGFSRRTEAAAYAARHHDGLHALAGSGTRPGRTVPSRRVLGPWIMNRPRAEALSGCTRLP